MIVFTEMKPTNSFRTGKPQGIKKIIAVHSGKGGVGKTTLSILLAYHFAQNGHCVGLLDLDIDCPNITRTLGIAEKHRVGRGKKIIPLLFENIKIVSMGGILGSEDQPLFWRGPRTAKAIEQLFWDSDWGELDVLVVDFPPGTSDEPITFFNIVKPDQVIIVSTPQINSLFDSAKSVQLCKRLGAPVLGVVTNMSGPVFGYSDAAQIAQLLQVDWLGDLKLSKKLASARFWKVIKQSSCDKILRYLEKMIFRDG